MEKLLSIIVPAYNVERYLQECLQSLVVCSGQEQVEVLIINDGSTDNTKRIAEGYVDHYPMIFQVISKENGGHGSALNRGIQEASGKYLKVVDGDDWLDTEELEKLLCFLRNADQDIIATNYFWVDTHSRKKTVQQRTPFKGVIYGKTYTLSELRDKCYIKMHSMTVRTEIIRKSPFPIDEHCYYVDSEYVMYPIPFAESVVFLDSWLYQYRVGRKHQSVNLSQMAGNKAQHLKVFCRLLEYYDWVRASSAGTGQIDYLQHGIALIFKSQYKVFLCCPYSEEMKKELIHFDRMVMEKYPEIYRRADSKAVKLIRMFHFRMFRLIGYIFRFSHRIMGK